MNISTEGTNTQKMVQHNQAKERSYADSLSRKTTDLVTLPNGRLNIDFRESIILNSQNYSKEQLVDLFGPNGQMLLSDVDAQILIKLKFIDKVDCGRIVFYPVESVPEETSFARRIKLFVNKPEMDFGDVSDTAGAAEFELGESGESPQGFPLAGSRFARISSIQILIEDNWKDTDVSVIGRIGLEGLLTPTYEYK